MRAQFPAPKRLLCASLLLCLCALPAAAQGGGDRSPGPSLLAPLSDGAEIPLPELDPALPSPQAFLGGPLGGRFHRHEEILRYLETLAAASERLTMWDYGETYEGRPLRLLAISSPENIRHLEEIRRKHLRLAAPALLPQAERDALAATQPAFAWLAYGIHGNESSSSEAALGVVYVLAAAKGEWERWLREVVVLVDPLSNPDGRERYVSGYLARRGREADPDPASFEHSEPWPGGRYNHYLVDLNRDWAWATQQETRYRLASYRSWEPQVYVDLHEMGSDSTYYFPPPAEPVHPAVDRRVLRWLELFGQGNARAFDGLGWLFYTGQRYDLFYPGYGDSYPSLRGAVGMTYEVAGGGKAGQVLRLADGSQWTLADRVARHLVTSLATVAAVAKHRVALLRDFTESRLATSPRLPQSILWEGSSGESRALADLLSLHGIAVGQLSAEVQLAAVASSGGGEERRSFPAGTYAVSTAQPLSGLVEALLKVGSPLSPGFVERQRRRVEANLEAEFFDITAWALPLAFNVETWTVYGEPPAQVPVGPRVGGVRGAGDLGWAVPPQGLASFRLAAELARIEVRHRLALAPFQAEGRELPRGTLVIPRRGSPGDFEARLGEVAAREGLTIHRLASAASEAGVSLGSDDLVPVRPVSIGLAIGPGTQPTSAGHLWHLLDRELGLPHRLVALADLRSGPRDLDVLILPESRSPGDELGEEGVAALKRWVEAGGNLVAVGDASAWLIEKGLFPASKNGPQEDGPAPGGGSDHALPQTLQVAGAVVATRMNDLHPLTAGLLAPPPVLVRGGRAMPTTGLPDQDVLTVAAEQPVLAGVAWPEAEENLAGSLLVGAHRLGQGQVIVFAQDPAFRLFWRGTMPLFLNAVMFGPSW